MLEAFPAKTHECVLGEDTEFIVLLISIAPLKKTRTELAVTLCVRQGVVLQ